MAWTVPNTVVTTGADLGGGGALSYMKNDVMHTVIYAAFCMLPSFDLQLHIV